MSQFAIDIQKLTFAYPGHDPVLNITEFQVNNGEHVFLHGPSGCGKTTLLGLITGILDTQGGDLNILGRSFAQMNKKKRDDFRGSHMGYIFQMFNLIPYLTVEENILLPCRINEKRRGRVKGKEREEVQTLAEGLGIASFLSQNVKKLSVGQQQRVAAARALAGQPEIIIADEPTSSLDHDHRKDFINVLFEQADRHHSTVLFVSHDHTLKDLFHRSVSLPEINKLSQKGRK